MSDTSTLLGLRDAADTLAVSEMTVRRLVKAGKIPAFQAGRKYRIRKQDLQAYIRQSMALVKSRARPMRGAA